jgi:hypothetical protein
VEEPIQHAGNIPEEEWPEYFDWLVEKRIAVPEDRAEFDKHFTGTQRSYATPRPGISVTRRWQMSEAEDLDASGKLAGEIAEAFETMTAELGKSVA